MKHYALQSIKIIAIALFIGMGVSAVSAWTAPTVNPPATGTVKSPNNDTARAVSASINVTNFAQIKRGGLFVTNPDGRFVSPLSFFKKMFLPDAQTAVHIGGQGTASPTFATGLPAGTRAIPLTLQMTGRADNDAIMTIVDPANTCALPARFETDSSAFQLFDSNKNNHADILAKGIRLTGGNPEKGKILIAVDADGKAVWAVPKIASNGKDIIFDTTASPVGSCEVLPPPPPPVLCTDATATNYNQPAPCTYAPVLCPNGSVKPTNGDCPTSPNPSTSLCSNVPGIASLGPNVQTWPDGSCTCQPTSPTAFDIPPKNVEGKAECIPTSGGSTMFPSCPIGSSIINGQCTDPAFSCSSDTQCINRYGVGHFCSRTFNTCQRGYRDYTLVHPQATNPTSCTSDAQCSSNGQYNRCVAQRCVKP